MRTRIATAAVLFAALAWGACATARAEVGLTEVLTEGDAVYVLDNGSVRTTVAPAAGGALQFRWQAPDGNHERSVTLAADSYDGRLCRYRVADQTSSGSIAMLLLHWSDTTGVAVTKAVSLLDGAQSVRVDYSIANASRSNALFGTEFRFGSFGEEWNAAVRCGRSLKSGPAGELCGSEGTSFNFVDWFALTAPGKHGMAVLARGGALRQLDLQSSGEPAAVVGAGQTNIVPAGRSMETGLVIIPFERIGAVTSVTETHVCAVSAEVAAAACRISVEVVPLVHGGEGRGRLDLKVVSTGETRSLDASRLTLVPGKVTPLMLYWADPRPGTYDMSLFLPGLEAPLDLGRCQVGAEGLRLQPSPPPAERIAFGTARLQMEEGPPMAGRGTDGWFHGPLAAAIRSLHADVGIDETETLLAGIPIGPRRDMVEASLSRVTAERRGWELPPSAWEFLRVKPGGPDATTSVPGIIETAGPGPVLTGSPVALRLRCPEVHPALYSGQLEVRRTEDAASLPLGITVWPVRRLRPGPVRLYVADPLVDPFGQAQSDDAMAAALRRCEVVNTALSAPAIARTTAVQVLSDADAPMPLAEWLQQPRGAEDGQEFPALDFSASTPCLTGLLLCGRCDVTMSGRIALDEIAPSGCPAERQATIAEWYWGEFARHLRRRGFDRLCFVSPEPCTAADLTDEWFAAAKALRGGGWSVCGPYDGSVRTPELMARLSGVTDLMLLQGSTPAGSADAPEELPDGIVAGSYMRGMPWDVSAADGRRVAHVCGARGVRTILLGRLDWPSPPSGTDAKLRALDSLAWEGFRDGLDEICYAARLSGRRQAEASADASEPTKREVLAQLSAQARAGVPPPPTLYWRDLMLVEGGNPRAVIACDPDSAIQQMQADLLNALIVQHCGSALPVVDVQQADRGLEARIALVFGSPTSNALVSELAGSGADRLAGRLVRNGCSCEEFSQAGMRYVGLLSASSVGWGTPVLCFAAGLCEEEGAADR